VTRALFLGPGVVPSKKFVVDGQRGVAERQRFGRVAVHPLAAQYGSAVHARKPPVNCCPSLNSVSVPEPPTSMCRRHSVPVHWWDRATEPEAWFVRLRDRFYPPSTISM
jgi:hypothetical protein